MLAIIPARGGSKGILRKNLTLVGNRPLLAWTIAAARAASAVARVVVSTEDPEIADIARAWGAEVPFVRPAGLAQDDTPGTLPIVHAVRWLEENENERPELVACLQATSPLRTGEDIDRCVELTRAKQADAVVSVTHAEHHPYWVKQLDQGGRISDFLTLEKPVSRRQDLPPAYALNGAIYVVRRDVLLREETLFPRLTYGYVMPRERSIDIDTTWDLHLADLLLRERIHALGT